MAEQDHDERDDITLWIRQLSGGDEQAAARIWEQYFSQLVSYARGKMQGMARRVADEEDVALSAINSFIRGLRQGRFPQLNDRHDLWKLLLTITARKAHAQRRRDLRKKRGEGVVRGESVFVASDGEANTLRGMGQILGKAPTPELAAMVLENTRQMIDCLEDDTLRHIALEKLEGYTTEEIARKLGVVPRTVERKLSRIRAIWQNTGWDTPR